MANDKTDKLARWAKVAFVLATLPVWFPVLMLLVCLAIIGHWLFIRWHAWRPIERAWEKCAGVWLRERWVWAADFGDLFCGAGFVDVLARTHRNKRPFFLKQLRNPQPVLAAYACVCLARDGLRHDEVPEDVRQRKDMLRVRYADTIEGEPLGEFVMRRAAEPSTNGSFRARVDWAQVDGFQVMTPDTALGCETDTDVGPILKEEAKASQRDAERG
jgi:hypothetical protein